MKNLFTILFALILVGSGFRTQAAFPLKQAVPVSAANQVQKLPAITETESMPQPTSVTKQSASRKRVANTLPQALYVVMAIFLLGWLAMGINDNFEESDWVISLLLYILMYLPGLIFTLIKMSKYY